MNKVTDVLINGVWLTQQPTIKGQRVRETTYFDDGTFGFVEYTFESAPEVVDMRITKRCFLDRLFPQEEIAIDLASAVDTAEAASVRRFMRRIDMSPFVDLSLKQTADGLHMVEQEGLIAEGRANEILTAPIQEHERYRG